MINALDTVPRQTHRVLGMDMSVGAAGTGHIVVLLHGNGTFSYLWRNIIPYLAQRNRVIAPDLLGMGRSALIKPSGPSTYSFEAQLISIDALLDVLAPRERLVLIGHELGALLAIELARREPSRIAGIGIVEGAFRVTNDATLDPRISTLLRELRGAEGDKLVLDENAVIERYLPMMTQRTLLSEEVETYARPFDQRGEARRALLAMIRQLPLRSIAGPLDTLANEARRWCAGTEIPKLVLGGSPGYLVPPSVLGTTARWQNTSTEAVKGIHLLPEDSPARVAIAILDWLDVIGY